MATASVRKTLANPGAQRAIASKAAKLAKEKIASASKALKEKYKRAAPALRKDVIEAFVIPGVSGVLGAVGVDYVLDRFDVFEGAKGDIAKILAGVTVGTVGRKYLRGSPYVHHAALGVVVVNAYKLATRVTNRMVAGKSLSGLLDDGDNSDLSGYWGNTTHLSGMGRMEAVYLQLADGSVIGGFQDEGGNLYDETGALIVFEDEQMQGLPIESIPPITNRVQLASGAFVN